MVSPRYAVVVQRAGIKGTFVNQYVLDNKQKSV